MPSVRRPGDNVDAERSSFFAVTAKLAIFTASVFDGLLAAVVLGTCNRHYRRIAEDESIDQDTNDIPDVYENRGDN